MPRKREVIQATPTLILSREYDTAAHEDPTRRGAYLIMAPGRVPEIVLDGLSREWEQQQAEARCRRELETALLLSQTGDVAQQEQTEKRRELVRLTSTVAVTRDTDPIAHEDPARRGAYLIVQPGKLPEIVLDGLAGEEEQDAAEQRLLHLLLTTENAPGPLRHLKAMLWHSNRPIGAPLPMEPASQRLSMLGQRLLQQNLISQDALQATLLLQKTLPMDAPVRRVGSLLIQAGLLSISQVARALGEQRGVQPAHSAATRVDLILHPIFPLDMLCEIEAAPLLRTGRTVAVAMVDPQRKEHVATLQSLTSYLVRPMQAPQLQVYKLLQSMKKGQPAES